VNRLAFGRIEEARLVARLRNDPAFLSGLSLVAETEDGTVVGHLLLTPAGIDGAQADARALALAPMAVLPAFQGQGVGSALVRRAFDAARAHGFDAIIVLGHPGFYPRFGFRPASLWRVSCPFEVPDEAFMAVELTEGALANAAGTVIYLAAFAEL